MRRWLVFFSVCLLAGCTAPSGKPEASDPEPACESVSYPSGGESVRGFLCHPDGTGPYPALMAIHGDFGLTEWEKEQAKRLARRGYAVLAIDLYRGTVVKEVEDAHIMDRGLPEDQVLGDLKAAVDFLAARPDARRESLGAIGWDMGGGYALDAALHDPRLKAVVTCYGRLTTDAALLAPLQAPVLGIFAEKDQGITPQTIEQFRKAMSKAGKRADIHVYPGCGKGFLNPASPSTAGRPPAESVADAWKQIEQFLYTELKR